MFFFGKKADFQRNFNFFISPPNLLIMYALIATILSYQHYEDNKFTATKTYVNNMLNFAFISLLQT